MGERRTIDDLEAGELAVYFDDKEPQEVIRWGLETFQPRIGLSASFQAEDMVILDMAWRISKDVRVFTLDTGRLPPETYELMDQVRERYGIPLEVLFPDAREVEGMVNRRGVNLMYKDVELRLLCCQIRKVRPLNRVLRELDAWFTGLRRWQWASRAAIRKVELDHDHGAMVKISPLADWTTEEVWDYVKANDVPYHKLYDKGYKSIGCAPCTRPVAPGEDPRAGRWWWEQNAPKECGIHCSILTGGFEHELKAILGEKGGNGGGV
jgi:thioredoxin-dependent adenylylsulfate APS reductase